MTSSGCQILPNTSYTALCTAPRHTLSLDVQCLGIVINGNAEEALPTHAVTSASCVIEMSHQSGIV